MDETDIIRRVVSGDSESFAELVRAHQARIRLACLVHLAKAEEADDAAQDVFVKAFQALPRFRGDASFLTWILRIADRHCQDLLRARRHREQSLDAFSPTDAERVEAMLHRPEEAVADPREAELLAKLLAAVPEEERTILALREIEDLSYEQIAERLSCSIDAVKGRLKRARQNLIEKLSPYFSDTLRASARL